MRSLSLLGVRSVRRNLGRYALTMVGTMLGVAVLFGVLITNAGISQALDRLAARNAHSVVLEATGTFGSDLPAATLVKASTLPGVANAYGNVWFRGRHGGPNGEEVY